MPMIERRELFKTGRDYIVQPKDTWCLIAWNEWGDPDLWFCIASASGAVNPNEEPKPGTRIKIPSYSSVLGVLAS